MFGYLLRCVIVRLECMRVLMRHAHDLSLQNRAVFVHISACGVCMRCLCCMNCFCSFVCVFDLCIISEQSSAPHCEVYTLYEWQCVLGRVIIVFAGVLYDVHVSRVCSALMLMVWVWMCRKQTPSIQWILARTPSICWR